MDKQWRIAWHPDVFLPILPRKFRTKKNAPHRSNVWTMRKSHRGNFLWLKPTMCNNSIDEKLRRLKAIKKNRDQQHNCRTSKCWDIGTNHIERQNNQTSSEPFLRKMPSSWEGKFPPPHTNKKYIYRGKPVGCRIQTPQKKQQHLRPAAINWPSGTWKDSAWLQARNWSNARPD